MIDVIQTHRAIKIAGKQFPEGTVFTKFSTTQISVCEFPNSSTTFSYFLDLEKYPANDQGKKPTANDFMKEVSRLNQTEPKPELTKLKHIFCPYNIDLVVYDVHNKRVSELCGRLTKEKFYEIVKRIDDDTEFDGLKQFKCAACALGVLATENDDLVVADNHTVDINNAMTAQQMKAQQMAAQQSPPKQTPIAPFQKNSGTSIPLTISNNRTAVNTGPSKNSPTGLPSIGIQQAEDLLSGSDRKHSYLWGSFFNKEYKK